MATVLDSTNIKLFSHHQKLYWTELLSRKCQNMRMHNVLIFQKHSLCGLLGMKFKLLLKEQINKTLR